MPGSSSRLAAGHRGASCDAGMASARPTGPSSDIETYQHYIRESKAEFSVAKHGYVVTHSGWFSERTACYLASGRPALAQDTGFSDWLEGQAGVLAFTTPGEALAAIAALNDRYAPH